MYKTCESLESFFNTNFLKFQQKIEKLNKKNLMKDRIEKYDSSNDIQIISNSEDEKIAKRLRSLFSKIAGALDITDKDREEIINLIVKNIIKRNKSFEQIYDDTMKAISKIIKNENSKNYFSKKFRKLLRSIKNEKTENNDIKGFNIKINLNETEEKREEKDKLEMIKSSLINFIDNQKIPEVYREITEYPIEPHLKKKISSFISEVKNNNIFIHNQ